MCLARSANSPKYSGSLLPYEYTPLITYYLKNLCKDELETLNHYLDMILIFSHASAGKFACNIRNLKIY